MKRVALQLMIGFMVGLGATVALATGNEAARETGNGALSGPHYNLNILGKERCAGDDLTDSERHTIQVLLDLQSNPDGTLAATMDKRNKIFLVPSEVAVGDSDLHVLDGNACDGNGALFALPLEVSSSYGIWARAGGKPGGEATITTCATGPGEDAVLGTADDEIVCSTENVVLLRTKGQQKFTNVTRELTTLCWDTDGDDVCDTRLPLFDSALEGYFWNYSNNGLRLAQLRFYPN